MSKSPKSGRIIPFPFIVSNKKMIDREAFLRDIVEVLLRHYTADELIEMVKAATPKRGGAS